MELGEVTPAYDCPYCVGTERRGQTTLRDCDRCGGSKRIGHEGPLPAGVALDENDRARFYAEGQLREPGEGVHPLHWCATVVGADAA